MALSQANFMHQGYPIRVAWMGWETDTLSLYQHGWQMATQHEPMYNRMGVIFKHPKQRIIAYGLLEDHQRILYSSLDGCYGYDNLRDAVIQISSLGTEDRLFVRAQEDFTKGYSQVDMEPQIIEFREMKFSEMSLFRRLQEPIQQELIVDPQDVQSMMDQILKLQSVTRKDIRQREARRNREEKPQERMIHAQIISFPEAA